MQMVQERPATSLEIGPTVDSDGSMSAVAPVTEASERSSIGFKPHESSSSLRRAHAIAEQEHMADVLRLRTVMIGALLLWGITAILDWSVVRFVQPGPLAYFLWLRGSAWLIMSAIVVRLYLKPPPTRRSFAAIELALFSIASLTASLLCLRYRGIASPYAHAISCVLVARGIALPCHYRWGIPAVLFPASLFPLTMLCAMWIVPEIRTQFQNPAETAIFLQNLTLILATGAMTVLGGHSMWALRRQVFAARNIGRYRLQHRIGQGGMGEVWQAYHPSLRRAVAIKLLRSHQSSPHALARFEREVRATSELTHPNTIRVFDFGVTDDGLWYYAMELLSGETIAELMDRKGPLPFLRAVKLLRQACRALAEAHARGIVHRDIKPDNLFLTTLGGEPDFIKVLDFGIAKLIREDLMESSHVTVEGSLLGTPAYMSPEQFEGHVVDARTDVFSLGAVLFFMLTGSPPYRGSSLTLIRAAHFAPIERPSSLTSDPIPSELEDIILRCLEREPTLRYPEAGELDKALAAIELAALPRIEKPSTPTGSSASAQPIAEARLELAGEALTEKLKLFLAP